MSTENPLHNKYSLVKGAARRARQLQSGALPLMATKSMKACRVAQDEIIQGRVTFVVSPHGITRQMTSGSPRDAPHTRRGQVCLADILDDRARGV